MCKSFIKTLQTTRLDIAHLANKKSFHWQVEKLYEV